MISERAFEERTRNEAPSPETKPALLPTEPFRGIQSFRYADRLVKEAQEKADEQVAATRARAD